MSYHHICDTAVTARAALKCPRGGAARATNARGAAELQTAVISGCTRVSVTARPRLCHGAVKWCHGRCVRACAILHMLRVILSEFIYYIYICVFYSHSWSEGSAAVGSCARAGCADQTSPPLLTTSAALHPDPLKLTEASPLLRTARTQTGLSFFFICSRQVQQLRRKEARFRRMVQRHKSTRSFALEGCSLSEDRIPEPGQNLTGNTSDRGIFLNGKVSRSNEILINHSSSAPAALLLNQMPL